MSSEKFNICFAPATLSDDRISIVWKSKRSGIAVATYDIFKNGKKVATQEAKKTHYTFKNLMPECNYQFQVIANLENGKTVSSELLYVKTLDKKSVIDVTASPYFADPTGEKCSTERLQKAINDCPKGGIVLIPEKTTVLSGALQLKSDMTFQVDGTLQGSLDPKDYTISPDSECPGEFNQDGLVLSRYEGWEMYCYRSLVNAGWLNPEDRRNIYCQNIRICGKGRIVGGGNSLGYAMREIYSDSEQYPEYESDGIPGRRTRGRLLSLIQCKNVHITEVTFENPPCWTIHILYCDTVTTNDILIRSRGVDNGDGWDPDSSKNLMIFDTRFDTGDDCIAIKSGKNPEGNEIAIPAEKIWIFDLEMVGGNGMAIGSEMSGGVNDVLIENCLIKNTNYGLDIKAHGNRGGFIRNIKVFNCQIDGCCIHEVAYNSDGKADQALPVIENISLVHCQITDPNKSILLKGFSKGSRVSSLKNIVLKDLILFNSPDQKAKIQVNNVETLALTDVRLRNGGKPSIEEQE
jgi:exo-poly-alpha-galacturonosidase